MQFLRYAILSLTLLMGFKTFAQSMIDEAAILQSYQRILQAILAEDFHALKDMTTTKVAYINDPTSPKNKYDPLRISRKQLLRQHFPTLKEAFLRSNQGRVRIQRQKDYLGHYSITLYQQAELWSSASPILQIYLKQNGVRYSFAGVVLL